MTAMRIACVLAATVWVGFVGLLGLLRRPDHGGCIMTYMYPTFIPFPPLPSTAPVPKYGLYLYHEGWRKIDHRLQLLKLSGVPVLFIPGNGGSYKQVRSLAVESYRAFNNGPLQETFYRAASVTEEEAAAAEEEAGESLDGSNVNQADSIEAVQDSIADLRAEGRYPNHLDWFSVDLDGELSAMDGIILEEHTEYAVQAIHRILDRYKESLETRSKERSGFKATLPTSVILVGHSMGGFVARAAAVHPGLRKGAVQTILTLSSPHLSPPLAMQPSLGYFYSRINNAWRNNFDLSPFRSRRWRSNSALGLRNVTVVSLVGGPRDYQVRSKMASLDGIVPPTNGFTIGALEVFNVWLSMEHQSILWCNQLVVQVSHTLLQLVDRRLGQPFVDPHRRISTFVANLRTSLPQSLGWMSARPHKSITERLPSETGGKIKSSPFSCPRSVKWSDESHENDLFIETSTVTILAMDGRRRWLDIEKLSSNGKDHFALVTNLQPCFGVRVHLWPEKHMGENPNKPFNQIVVEVTTMMVQLPVGLAPQKVEPGGQTEQAPPSGFLRLTPKELHGFRFITISVAPSPSLAFLALNYSTLLLHLGQILLLPGLFSLRLTRVPLKAPIQLEIISGRPPHVTSMAVGQFFKPIDSAVALSPFWLLSSFSMKKELYLEENHPLVLNYSVSVSMGVLPLTMELKTVSCGIHSSDLADQQSGDNEGSCRLRCFPPVVVVWDPLSGLSVIPNFYSGRIEVDSSAALWGARHASKGATILTMVDPHCAYTVSMAVSLSAAATRFLLVHGLQIAGFAVAILLYALMQQARAWELNQPVPSLLDCLERNLSSSFMFISLNATPLLLYSFIGLLRAQASFSFITFVLASLACYLFANGVIMFIVIGTWIIFHIAASLQTFLSVRWTTQEGRLCSSFSFRFLGVFSSMPCLQIIHMMRGRPVVTSSIFMMSLVVFTHPAIGMMALLLVHVWGCYSRLAAFSGSYRRQKGSSKQLSDLQKVASTFEGSAEVVISFSDTQLENFHLRQGLLVLHLIATAMLVPSLVAVGQKFGMDLSFPRILDTSLCFGIILHGLLASKADVTMPFLTLRHLWRSSSADYGMSIVYLMAGMYCYLSALDFAPYRSFYALAAIGLLSAIIRVFRRRRVVGSREDSLIKQHLHLH